MCDAQSRLEIMGADALQFSQRNGMKVTRLIGNVKLKQDRTLMNCDSAYKFEDKNYVEAYGHVFINHEDSLFLYGDELEYDGNQRKAKLRGNARMTEKDFTLTTTDIDFDLNAGRADYDNGGRITGSSGVLTSSFG
ncbi:MAG: OstA-like protein, partial [Bacteroidota bacterium]